MMVDPEEAIRRIKELERELENSKGSYEVVRQGYKRIMAERDALAERAEEAEALAIYWQNRHADLYVSSEEWRNRAKVAEPKLDALQVLIVEAAKITGIISIESESSTDGLTLYAGDVAAQPKYWR